MCSAAPCLYELLEEAEAKGKDNGATQHSNDIDNTLRVIGRQHVAVANLQ